jgi:anaphase-promoting complex subunit 3
MKRYALALHEYQEVLRLAPKEYQVHVKIAAIHKTMGDGDLALKHYQLAMDLESKSNTIVRDAIEDLQALIRRRQ